MTRCVFVVASVLMATTAVTGLAQQNPAGAQGGKWVVSNTTWNQETGAYREAFNKLPAKLKAAIWQKKIRWCLDRIALTPTERAAVERGLALAVESKYKDTIEAGMAQKEQDGPFWNDIETTLGQEKFRAIFVALPKREILEVTPVPPLADNIDQEVDTYRRAFIRLTASQKATIWQNRIRRCLDTVALTRIERGALEKGLAFIAEAKHSAPLEASTPVSDQDKPFWDGIRKVLGHEKFVQVFMQMPREEILEVTGFPPMRDTSGES